MSPLGSTVARRRVDHLVSDQRESPRRARSGRWLRWLGGLVAAVLGALLIGVLLVAATAAAVVAWRRSTPIRYERQRRAAVAEEMPDALERFVLLVHAGLTPRLAIEHLASSAAPAVRDGFAAVVDRLARGDALADALTLLPEVLGADALGLADLIGSADRYGLPLAPVLEQLAAQARADRRRADEAAARALPVKLSFPLVACTLPSFVLLAIAPAVLAALSSLRATSF